MSSTPCILIVDDDPHLLQLTSRLLRHAGYRVIEAGTSAEGRLLAVEHTPNLILLDVVLPDIDGISMCQGLKTNPALARTLIVLFSARKTDSQAQIAGLECGADGYIVRPIPNHELLARVKIFLRLQAALTANDSVIEALHQAQERLEEQVAERTAQVQVELSERIIATEKLRDSEEKYRTLFENMAQGAFLQNADGALVDCNPAVLEMFGLTREQFLSKKSLSPNWRVISEDGSELSGAEHPSMVALRTGKPVRDVVAGIYNPRIQDYVWLTVNAIPLFRPGETRPYQVFVTLHDFTERRKAEQKVQDTTLLLTEAQKVGQFGSWDWNFKTNQTWWSDSLYEIYGRDPGAGTPPYENDQWLETTHPDDRERLKQSIADAITNRAPYEIQYRIRRENDGERRTLASRGKLILAQNGEPERLIGVAQDITEGIRSEEKLRDSEAQLRAIYENSLNAIMVADDAGHYLAVNPAAAVMFGYSTEQLLGMKVGDLQTITQPGAAERYQAYLQNGQEIGEFDFIRPDQQRRIAQYHAVRVRENFNLSILSDITDRVRTEQALHEQNRFVQHMTDMLPYLLYVFDLHKGYDVYINRRTEAFFGLSLSALQAKGQHFFPEVLHPDDRAKLAECEGQWDTALDGESFEKEYRLKNAAGNYRWIRSYESVFSRGADGKPDQIVGTAIDITDRKQAEDALAESEKNLHTFFDTLSEGVALNEMVFNDQGEMIDYRILEVNPAFYSVADYGDSDVIGNVATRLYGMSSDFIKAFWMDHRENTTLTHTELWSPLNNRCFYISTSPFRDGRFVTSFFDITEIKHAEAALQKSEESLKQAQRVSHVGNWTWHIATNSLEWSDEMYRIFGIDKESFTGNLAEVIQKAIHPDDRAAVEASNLSVIHANKPVPLEYRVVHPDGTVRTVWAEAGELVLDAAGNPAVLTGIVQDITDRKQAQNALLESEKKYRLLFENMMNGFALHEIVLDTGGQPIDYVFLEANAAFERITGLRREAIIGKRVTEVLPGIARDPADWIGRYGSVALTGQPARFEQLAQDIGKWFSVLAFSPRKHQFASVFEDITERKQAEEEVRRLNLELEARVLQRTAELARTSERLDLATGAAQVGVWDWDIPQDTLSWDATTCALFGVTQADFRGNHQAFLQRLHPDDRDRIDTDIQKALHDASDYTNEFRILLDDGEARHIRAAASIKYAPDGTAERMTGVNWDITEYNRILAELQTFNEVMVDREGRIIELKEEVNRLATALGQALPYPPVWEDEDLDPADPTGRERDAA